MFFKLAEYTSQSMKAKKTRLNLAMNILVKDEVDIIGANIKVHSELGIDSFNVMDNASKDGTRELLAELSKEYDINIIDKQDQSYKQAEWMTELNHVAKKRGADLVFNNDADEFYIPQKGVSYRDVLSQRDSVVTLPRYNMALGENALDVNYQFWDSTHAVCNPIMYSPSTQINQDGISMLLVKISPKVITNPYGLFRLKGGNHRAKHVMKLFNARNESKIEVFHYPIRSFDQFKSNIENRCRLLKLGAKMGDHYRRWVRLYESGGLESEYERIVLSDSDFETLKKIGVVEEVNHPRLVIGATLA